MKALIFENKIVDTADVEFEVVGSMSWIDCPDECKDGLCVLEDGIPVVVTVDNTVPALTYFDLRQEAYPAIEDQLDDIFHNGIEGWKTTIQAVKDKYPKPE